MRICIAYHSNQPKYESHDPVEYYTYTHVTTVIRPIRLFVVLEYLLADSHLLLELTCLASTQQ